MTGLEQRTLSPVTVFERRNPPAAALAVPVLATIGSETRAVVPVEVVTTEPGLTPMRTMSSAAHVGRIPFAVENEKVPDAGRVSTAWAGAAATRASPRVHAAAMVRRRIPASDGPAPAVRQG